MTSDELRALADAGDLALLAGLDIRDAARLLADARDTLAYGLPPIEHTHIVSAFTGEMEGRCRTCEIHELLARFAALGTETT